MTAEQRNEAAAMIAVFCEKREVPLKKLINNLTAEPRKLRDENRGLREALKPFANKQVIKFYSLPTPAPDDYVYHTGLASGNGKITVGDLRKAQDALKGEDADGHSNDD